MFDFLVCLHSLLVSAHLFSLLERRKFIRKLAQLQKKLSGTFSSSTAMSQEERAIREQMKLVQDDIDYVTVCISTPESFTHSSA